MKRVPLFEEFINESQTRFLIESFLNENVNPKDPRALESFLLSNEKHFAAFLKPKKIITSVSGPIFTISPASKSFTITVDTDKETVDSTGKPAYPESVSYIETMEWVKYVTKFKVLNESALNENQGFSGTFTSLNDLMKAVKKLPDTIKSIKVQANLSSFNPDSIELNPKDNKDWRKEVENILKKALKEKGGNEIDEFTLRSYYGVGRPTDPYYINLDSKSSRDFAERMGRGEYGSLD